MKYDQERLTKLADIVEGFVTQEAPRLAQTYDWRIPTDTPVPLFSIGTLSLAEANIQLRRALATIWHDDPSRRFEIANWYVKKWGGVLRNSDETIKEYVESSESDLAARRLDGVASWSKILAIRNPGRYAIFDARVSTALNALQILRSAAPILYPNLPSRKRAISDFQKWLRVMRDTQTCDCMPRADAYGSYLTVVRTVAERLGHSGLDQIEMSLFANSEHLAAQAMGRIDKS